MPTWAPRATGDPSRRRRLFEPWWIQIIKALVIFALALAILPLLTVYERKLLGRFQGRYGPNHVGPFGLMQPLAEIVKFATKEPSRPTGSIGMLFRSTIAVPELEWDGWSG